MNFNKKIVECLKYNFKNTNNFLDVQTKYLKKLISNLNY